MPIFLVKPQWVVTLIATSLVACDVAPDGILGGGTPSGPPAPPHHYRGPYRSSPPPLGPTPTLMDTRLSSTTARPNNWGFHARC